MWIDLIALLAGCALLYGGGEALVEASARIGKSLGWSDVVIGLVLVSFGTSAPELFVSVGSVLQGFNDLAIGNVVGSNIVNIALVLGLGAIITPLSVASNLRYVQFPLVMGISILAVLFLTDGLLGRFEAFLLLTVAAAGVWYALSVDRDVGKTVNEHTIELSVNDSERPGWKNGLLMITGIAGLIIGAELLILGGVGLSRDLGISEAVIALTVTAVGTSLPEITATLIAVARKNGDLAVGNVVGSNMMNLGLVLGIAGMVKPIDSGGISLLSTLTMLSFTGFAMVIAIAAKRFTRITGVILILAYCLYVSILFTRG